MNFTKLAILLLSLIIIPAIACGGSSIQGSNQQPTRAVVEFANTTPLPAVDSVSQASPTATPEPPPTPTPIPEPVYQEPVVLLKHSAIGGTVSDNFTLSACQKAVFNYSVQASDTGYASLILKLNRIGEDREMSLVNDMKETPQMMGQVLQPLLGGNYFFTSENTNEPWQMVIECHDNTAPVAEGMDVSGDTPTVTKNYRLSACQKSVFIWETQPGDSGYASIIARLAQTNIPEIRGSTLANDMKEGSLTGEALQAVETGDYFLVVENISGPWHVRWECKD